LTYYIRHQQEVITRRTQFDLNRAQARAHILEGLTKALENLDDVIKMIRSANSATDARDALINSLQLTAPQAQAILDLRLQKLTSLERDKIETDYKDTLNAIQEFKSILADEHKVIEIIKNELTAVKNKFADERRTKITYETPMDFKIEDLLDDSEVAVTITHGGYIKRISLDTYKRQKRGGKGITGMGTKEEDYVEHLIVTTTHTTILLFTNRGRVFYLKAYDIAESGRQAKGMNIINLLQMDKDETITAAIPVKTFDPTRYLFMATKRGIVKKVQLSEFKSITKKGIIAIKLDKNDELIGVKFTEGERYMIIGTKMGMVIAFDEEEVRSMGRNTRGVKGITLRKGDCVVGMDKLRHGADVLSVTAEGYGKRTSTEEFRAQGRGGVGVINTKVTDKTGEVIGLKVVNPDQELMLITTEGIVIRTDIADISVIGRNTQGVKLIKVNEGDKVAALAAI